MKLVIALLISFNLFACCSTPVNTFQPIDLQVPDYDKISILNYSQKKALKDIKHYDPLRFELTRFLNEADAKRTIELIDQKSDKDIKAAIDATLITKRYFIEQIRIMRLKIDAYNRIHESR